MNKQIAERWADELESGKYEQGTMCLHHKDGGYCCLGVLCEIASKDGVIPPPTLAAGNTEYIYGIGPDVNCAGLPEVVREWSGVRSSLGKFVTEAGDYFALYELNDSGTAFPRIAALIRKHAEEL